jgi:hypothetical protein
MTQANNVAIESSQINSSGVLLTTGGGTGLSTVGTNGQVLTSNGTTLSWVTPTTTSPGGSNTQVQFNSSGSFGGSANMVFDGSTLTTLNSAYTGTLTGGTGVVNLGSGQFYKDASGNVGIGTSSPSVKLDVSQSVNASATIRLTNSNAGTSSSSGLNVSNGTSGGQFTIAGTSYGGYGAWLASETMAYAGTNLVLMADSGSGVIKFAAGGNGEKMRIDSSGNVKLSTASTSILNSSGRPMLNQTGGILQVVNAALTGSVSTSSSSMVDTGLTATITPSSTSSKILVLVTLNQISCDNASLTLIAVTRNGSTFVYNSSGGNATSYQAFASGGGQSNNRQLTAGSLTYLDSPASSSALTYKVRIANNSGTATSYLNQWALNTDAGGVSTITLMEIAQ